MDTILSILLIERAAYQDVYLSCSATLDSDCDYAGLALDSRLRAVARARRASRLAARAAACQGLVFGFVDATNFWVRLYDNATMRLRDIEQLEAIAAGYRSRGRFVTDLTLDPPTSTSDLAGPPKLDEDYLILSTIHSAKGCEWDVVNIIHAADDMIPSDMATGDEAGVDEERRLFYVAMTRAKDHLHVYFPLRYYHTKHRMGDAHSYAQLTRFISPSALRLFEQQSAATEIDDDPPTDPSNVQQVDRWVNRLWGEE